MIMIRLVFACHFKLLHSTKEVDPLKPTSSGQCLVRYIRVITCTHPSFIFLLFFYIYYAKKCYPLEIMTEIFENLKRSVNEPLPGGGNGSAYLST